MYLSTETGAVVSSRRGLGGVERRQGVLASFRISILSEPGCKFGDKCSFAQRQVEEQTSKKPKKDGDKCAVAMLKITRQLGCVLQDIEPPKSSSILRKSTKVLGPIRRVRFSKATQRHANIRESKCPSLGMIQVKNSDQRSPYAPKFEDRSLEDGETRAMRPRRRVEICQEHVKVQRKGQSYILFTYR